MSKRRIANIVSKAGRLYYFTNVMWLNRIREAIFFFELGPYLVAKGTTNTANLK